VKRVENRHAGRRPRRAPRSPAAASEQGREGPASPSSPRDAPGVGPPPAPDRRWLVHASRPVQSRTPDRPPHPQLGQVGEGTGGALVPPTQRRQAQLAAGWVRPCRPQSPREWLPNLRPPRAALRRTQRPAGSTDEDRVGGDRAVGRSRHGNRAGRANGREPSTGERRVRRICYSRLNTS